MMLRVLDLFSGIGGFSLGLERTGGFKTVAFCEIEPYPRKVLAKHWPEVPCYNDIRELPHIGKIDVVCGGFPCQPFSTATSGKRRGKDDDRYLWPEMLAIIQRERPAWVIGENVVGIEGLALQDVVSDLEACGYDTAPPLEIPACAVECDHRRSRIWFLGHANGNGKSEPPINDEMAVLPGVRPVSRRDRAENGIPSRMDRLRALGNAVVPQIPELIGNAILASLEAA
jgi:DNA (cytosine-5)-methyltransferase 1